MSINELLDSYVRARNTERIITITNQIINFVVESPISLDNLFNQYTPRNPNHDNKVRILLQEIRPVVQNERLARRRRNN